MDIRLDGKRLGRWWRTRPIYWRIQIGWALTGHSFYKTLKHIIKKSMLKIEIATGADPAKVEYGGKPHTHFFQCWRYHHICAIAEIERLQEELAQALLKLRGQA